MTDIQERLADRQGQVHAPLPGARHRPGQLRGLDLARVLRGRAGSGVQAVVALRRPGGDGCPSRARSSPVSSRATWRRSSSPGASTGPCTPSTTSAPTAATRSCGRSTPRRSPAGSCRQFTCKYHGWRYGLDGCVTHVTNEEQFFDLDKDTLRMPRWPARCSPGSSSSTCPTTRCRCARSSATASSSSRPTRSSEMTQRYGFSTRINGNWKLAVDSVCEWYHPAVRPRPLHRPQRGEGREDGAAGRRVPLRRLPAPHAHLGPRAAAAEATGAGDGGSARTASSAGSTSCSGPACSAPTTSPTSGSNPTFLNKGRIAVLGQRPVLAVPEPLDPDLGPELLHHLHVLARVGRLAHLRDRPLLRAPGERATSASPRSWWSTARSSSPCRT